MTQTAEQKQLAKLETDFKKLEKLVHILVVRTERLEKENQRLKYAIGRTSRDLTSAQVKIQRSLK